MPLITLQEASKRLDVPEATIVDWGQRGLLDLLPDRLVDEDRLRAIAESMGWLQLSANGWSGIDEEE